MRNPSRNSRATWEVKPTIMTAVPRLYEVLEQRIRREAERPGGWRMRLFHKTLELGKRRYDRSGRLGLWEGLEDRLLDRLVRARIRERFGGRLKAFISGAPPWRRKRRCSSSRSASASSRVTARRKRRR